MEVGMEITAVADVSTTLSMSNTGSIGGCSAGAVG